jgi:hypothetical protein
MDGESARTCEHHLSEFPDWEFALHGFTDLRPFYRIESLLPTVIQPQAVPATVREAR